MHLRKGDVSLPTWGSSNKGNLDRWLGIGIDVDKDKYEFVGLSETHAQETTASTYNSSAFHSCIPGDILHYANEMVIYN